jgi:hypothetical protein
MKRIMEVSKRNASTLSKAKELGAQVSMIPVLRSLNRHPICNRLSAKLDFNRTEDAKWQLAGAVY